VYTNNSKTSSKKEKYSINTIHVFYSFFVLIVLTVLAGVAGSSRLHLPALRRTHILCCTPSCRPRKYQIIL